MQYYIKNKWMRQIARTDKTALAHPLTVFFNFVWKVVNKEELFIKIYLKKYIYCHRLFALWLKLVKTSFPSVSLYKG